MNTHQNCYEKQAIYLG